VTNGDNARDSVPSAPVVVAARSRTAEATNLLRRAPSAYLWNQLGSLWIFAASFVLSLIATRGLGQERYGIFAAALTFFNTAVYVAAFGLEDAATVFVPRTLAEHGPAATSALLRRILLTRAVAVLVVCAVIYFFSPALVSWLRTVRYPSYLSASHFPLPSPSNIAQALTIPNFSTLAVPVVAYIAGTGVMNMLGALFTALLRTRLTLVVGGLAQIGNVVGVYLAARLGYGVPGVLYALGIVAWAVSVVYLAVLLPLLRARATPAVAAPPSEPPAFTPVLRLGATAWLTNLISGALLKQVAVSLMLYFFVTNTAIGIFNLAFQLSHAAAFLLIAGLGGVGMAAMAAAFSGEDRQGLATAWRSVSKAQMLLAVPVLAFVFINANAVAALLYPATFAEVGVLMQVFLVFNIAQRIAGGGSHQAALYVLGRQRWAFAAQAAGLLLTLIVGALLIPQPGLFGGAGGALIAVGAGQVLVEVLQLALTWRLLRRAYPVQFGLRVVLALAPAVLVAAFVRPDATHALAGLMSAGAVSAELANAINLTLSGLIFVAVLFGGLLIARPVEEDDVGLIAQLNPRLRPILAPFAHRAVPPPGA
jgi:O-antigen/teichoic acid export membrane protein